LPDAHGRHEHIAHTAFSRTVIAVPAVRRADDRRTSLHCGRCRAIDDGKSRKEAINFGNALPAGFVPPPCSIADIAAILDNEKPDAVTLAKLESDAGDEPDQNNRFYYERANTRLLLDRQADASADAEKARAIASRGGDPMLKPTDQAVRRRAAARRLVAHA
jgi:hypothetical protein